MGLNKKRKIEDLKESRAVSEARERLRDDRTRGIVKWVFEIIVTLVFAVLVAISAFQTVTLQESAMEPTYSVGQKFFVNRALYKIKSPKRGDVIVFKTSASDDAALHIRRVIGLPGETVQIKKARSTLKEMFTKRMVLIRKSQMADLQTVLSHWKVESILFWEIIGITARTAVSAILEISARNIL